MERSSGISKADLLEPTIATLEADVDAIPASRSQSIRYRARTSASLPTSAFSKRLAIEDH
ncbi:hypothetical protein [Hyphomicrobium sp. 1Nfss2.1]|uniref:hypothetical protein n=1 Tax=Hyphomicrobium sp. 1Nfss2.1 TaxID=3413936 RepID=UPI003C7A4246